MTSRTGREGFTLVELCLVMGLLAVLVGLSWPSFASLRRGYALETTAQALVDCMSYARAAAIADGVGYKLVYDAPGRSIRLYRLDAPAAGRCGRGREVEPEIELSGLAEPLFFYPNGTSTGATVAVKDGKDAATTIELQGALGYARVAR